MVCGGVGGLCFCVFVVVVLVVFWVLIWCWNIYMKYILFGGVGNMGFG